jgi:hypothetical protein
MPAPAPVTIATRPASPLVPVAMTANHLALVAQRSVSN